MLPDPGAPHFLPRLLEHTESVRQGWSFSSSETLADVLAALLLVRIVNAGGLLLDVKTTPGERDEVFSVAAVVEAVRTPFPLFLSFKTSSSCWTLPIAELTRTQLCADVFGLRTAHLHLDQSSDPSDLPRRLTYHPSRRLSHHTADPQDRPSSRLSFAGVGQPRSRPRSRANTILSTKSGKSGKSGRTEQSVYVSARQSVVSVSLDGDTPSMRKENGSALLPPAPLDLGDGESGTSLDDDKDDDDDDGPPILASALIVTGLEDTNSPSMIKLVDILARRRLRLGSKDHDLPSDLTLIWVRDQNTKSGPGWLIDQFAYSLCTPAADLPPPPPPPPASEPDEPPIPPDFIRHLGLLLPYTHIHPPLEIHMSNLASAVNSHPRLASTLTGRFAHLFPQFVRAHRLLSRPFSLPRGWRAVLEDPGRCEEHDRFSLGGGRGGVYTWGREAGEEPSVMELAVMAKRHASAADGAEDCNGPGGFDENGSGSGSGGGEPDDEPLEDWYSLPRDVAGVFDGCFAHRVEWRDDGEEIMWLMKGGAGQLLKPPPLYRQAAAAEAEAAVEMEMEKEMQLRKTVRRKRRNVDRTLRHILSTV